MGVKTRLDGTKIQIETEKRFYLFIYFEVAGIQLNPGCSTVARR